MITEAEISMIFSQQARIPGELVVWFRAKSKIQMLISSKTASQNIMLSEISRSRKDKYLKISLICGI